MRPLQTLTVLKLTTRVQAADDVGNPGRKAARETRRQAIARIADRTASHSQYGTI